MVAGVQRRDPLLPSAARLPGGGMLWSDLEAGETGTGRIDQTNDASHDLDHVRGRCLACGVSANGHP